MAMKSQFGSATALYGGIKYASGGQNYAIAVAEVMTLADSAPQTLYAMAAIAETSAVPDAMLAGVADNTGLNESFAAADTEGFNPLYRAAFSENVASSDSFAVANHGVTMIAETATLADSTGDTGGSAPLPLTPLKRLFAIITENRSF